MVRIGILIILVLMPSVWSGNWKVTYKDQCALKGTSVVIKCEYDYPSDQRVNSFSWFKLSATGTWILLDVFHSDHFQYVGDYWHDCSLKINNVQHTDEKYYFFRFVTTNSGWSSQSLLQLSVKELTAVVKPSTVTEGNNVTLTCVSGCSTRTYVYWFRDGQRVINPVFQARREDAGKYYCAVAGEETARSASVALNVQYAPKNVTLSMSPPGDVFKGSSVAFSCSSEANPPVVQSGYSLYKDGQFISSGQNYTITDIQASHSGRYYCQTWNNISWMGIKFINSAEVNLDVQRSQSLQILSGIGVALFVTFMIALLLFWRMKQRTHAEKKTGHDVRLRRRSSDSPPTEDQSDNIYANIHMFPSSPPPVPAAQDSTSPSCRNSHQEHDANTSCEDEITYLAVTIKPRKAPQDSWSTAGENDDSVIYATVAKSN